MPVTKKPVEGRFQSEGRQRKDRAPNPESLLRTALGLGKTASAADRNQAAARLQPILFPVAFAVARKFKGIDARECADEAIQTWWCSVALALSLIKHYDPDRPLLPYAFQSLRYITIGLALKEQRNSAKDEQQFAFIEAGDNPRQIAEQREAAERLRSALEKLSARDRKIIQMRLEEDMTFDEIAIEMGVSAATVWRWISKALAQLRNELRDLGE